MNNSLFTGKLKILVLILVPVIGLSFAYTIYTIPQSTSNPQLIINSIDAQPLFWNGTFQEESSTNSSYTYFQLNISLQLVFLHPESINMSGLGLCSFRASLINSEDWHLDIIQTLMCMKPTVTNFQRGSYFFNLIEHIRQINSTPTANYSSTIGLIVYSLDSNNLNIQSQVYSLNLTSTSMSVKIENIQLNKLINPDNSANYQISAKLDFFTPKGFNLTYACGSPFALELVNSNSLKLTQIVCNYIMTHYIPTGDSIYYLMYFLVNFGSSALNSISKLPPMLSFQVFSSQLHLLSTIYNLLLS